MKKIALAFLLAVFVPSLVLAWLAVRSLRDQQLILERQQSLLYQGVADALAKEADDFAAARQREFGEQVESLLGGRPPADIASTFDGILCAAWPPAELGFVVTVNGKLLCPAPTSRPDAKIFYTENAKFLCNIQSAEVYGNNLKNSAYNAPDSNSSYNNSSAQSYSNQGLEMRKVSPQQKSFSSPEKDNSQQYSKVAPAEAEFRQLVGDSNDGTVARYLENKLTVLLWHRAREDSQMIFGAQLSLPQFKAALAPIVDHLAPALRDDIVVALLDDNARPVALSRPGFQAAWKHPFVSTELGEALPHWEMGVYLLNPAKIAASARALKFTLGLLIGVLLLAIITGSWLIVSDLNRQVALARQKTDFVSNVSHELKTPLTSIRMFSELLAEGRVSDPEKRQSYLNIITAETSRLTRLINNVLDFSRLERGEKKYHFQPCALVPLVCETVEIYRPHLEANGFKLLADLPELPITVNGDRDALAQIIVNLLSNAEKYSPDRKEISVQIGTSHEPLPHVDVRITDRGSGVPKGCEEKIFEQFYRAHSSLSSGIQGSGLGLTLARQIARAHGGDVFFQPHEGGGSCFTLRLPLDNRTAQSSA